MPLGQPLKMLVEKVTELPDVATPGTVTPDTMYLLANGTGFDIYISNTDGTAILPMNQSDSGIDSFLLMGATNGV